MLLPETCAKENFKFGGNWVSLKTAGWFYLMLLHDWLLPFVKQSINHALHYDVFIGNHYHHSRKFDICAKIVKKFTPEVEY